MDMAKGVFRLSAADLRRSTPGLYGDGHGLWLQVTIAKDSTRRNRSWVFRYTTNGRVREMGLGPLVTVGLADARERARQCRLQRLDGIDPIEHRKAQRAAQTAAAKRSMTFDECARALIAAKRNEWRSEKHAKQWPQTLARDISPVIGRLPVDAIDTALVVKALTPVWQRAPESGSRLRGRIEMILDWATVSGLRRGDNPARWGGHLEHLLPAPRKIRRGAHLPAMPYVQVPSFMQKLRGVEGTTARALEFLILTAARRGEVLGMAWDEVDFAEAVWTVPATRMKAGKEHRVPLPPPCLKILQQQQAVYENTLIFPGRDGPINDNGFKYIMRRLGADQYTPHGFRASFRTWASERTGFAHEIAEQALAHAVGSQITRAYRRTDMFDKRRALMTAWGDFCANPMAAAVTPLRRAPADA
jgi:integrase